MVLQTTLLPARTDGFRRTDSSASIIQQTPPEVQTAPEAQLHHLPEKAL